MGPLVREDGHPDPEFQLTSAPHTDCPPHPPALEQGPEIIREIEVEPAAEAQSSGTEGPATVHPVRARLLAKAGRARREQSLGGLAELEPEQAHPGRMLDIELDLVAAAGSTAPSAPATVPGRGHLSPTMVWLVGTLLGVVTVTTIVALAIRLDPHPGSFQVGPSTTPQVAARISAPVLPPSARKTRSKLPGPWRILNAEQDSTVRIVSGEIGRQAFLHAIEDAGVPKKETYRVLTALKGLLDLNKCDRRDRFAALVRRSDGRLKAFEYIVSKEEVYQAREGSDGLLRAARLDLKVVHEQVKGAFVMDGDFARSAERGGFEPSLARVLGVALNGHMSLGEIERGDMLRLIAQEVTVLGDFARYAGIEALEYRPADEKKKPLRIYYFRGPKSRSYFDGMGRAPYEGGWRKPIPGAPITSPFNLKRMHPVLKKVMPHLGIDYGAPAGTPVGASSYGTVSFIGYAGPAGNLVRVQHPDGVETGYAHLQRFAEGLRVGDSVKRLEVIGYVGSTGRSTGPHLHFMSKKDSKYFDPLDLKLDSLRVLPEDERASFSGAKASYDRELEAITWPAPLPRDILPAASAPLPQSEMDSEPIGMEDPPASAVPSGDGSPGFAGTAASGLAPGTPGSAGSARPSPRSVYLTDRELLESQPLTDDGESEQ